MNDRERMVVGCPDCEGSEETLSRRGFVRQVAGAALAAGLAPALGSKVIASAADKAQTPAAETAVKRLYQSLTADQKKVICFPFDDPLRSRINANWAITKPKIEELFNKDQQVLMDEIFRGVVSPEGYERFKKQMEEDSGGFDQYHVAIFGDPESAKFEWELTGRHVTLRADGNSVAGAAFGGPMIYGHGAGDGEKGLPGNVFYYQTLKANEVFEALDGTQRKAALQPKAPKEDAVKVQGDGAKFAGISVGDLSKDQQGLVEKVLKVLMSPYREQDVAEAMDILKDGGGLSKLHMAFYENEDLGGDHVWDIWRIEGPTFVWHFRGAPHVHAYVNIAKKS